MLQCQWCDVGGSILVVGAARLIWLGLVIIALRLLRVALVAVILILRLRIGLRVIGATARAWRRIDLLGRTLVGRVDVTVVGTHLRHVAAAGEELRLGCQLNRVTRGCVTLVVGLALVLALVIRGA